MKTKMHIRLLGIGIVLSLGIFLGSCTKEESLKDSEDSLSANLTLKNGATTNPEADDIMECELLAGQNISVGKVIYSHDEENLYVTYMTTNGWYLSELHLYVGTLGNLPTNKTAVKIGNFPYSKKLDPGTSNYMFTISLTEIGDMEENGYTIAAHAIVINGQKEETAWSSANCNYKPLITVKSNLVEGTYEFYATHDGYYPFINSGDWCERLGTHVYENGDVYYLTFKGFGLVNRGKVTVNENGTNYIIEVEADEGYKLTDSYLYVGSLHGLKSYASEANCVEYVSFPYTITANEQQVHTFPPIPMKPVYSMSFNEAFNSSRWGWLNYYKY